MDLKETENFLKAGFEAAQKGGKVLKKYLGKLKNVREKSFAGDLVTEADNESDEEILSHLHKHFPEHQLLSEESGRSFVSDSEFLWVIDPLDGTTNFSHKFPMFSISIALLQRNQPIIGVVFDPLHDEMFHAVKGEGSFLNQNKIWVSETSDLYKSLLSTGFAYDRVQTTKNNYAEFCHFTSITHGVRRIGSAALDLCYVASGRLDGYWERGLKIWDIAAGVLITQEAGGMVSSIDGSAINLESGRVLASNGKIHRPLSVELAKFIF